MSKAKEIFKKFKAEHPALSYDDIMVMYCITRKYGFNLLQELNEEFDEKTDPKYKKAQEKLLKIRNK